MSAIAPLMFLALGISGCARDPSASVAPVYPVPPEILAAPSQIAIGSTTLRLATYLWRDFMPGPTATQPLLARLRLQADGGSAIPPGTQIDKAWLVLDNEAWISVPQQEIPPQDASMLDVMSRGGPEWPVGAMVSVVVQIHDAANNSYLLRAEPQAIVRVE